MNITSINVLIEALNNGTPITRVFVSNSRKDRKIGIILDLCRQKKVPFQLVPQPSIIQKAGNDNQGVFAEMSPIKFLSLDSVLSNPSAGLILILDGITDTGNMGAIVRSAVAADVDAIIIGQHDAAPINETVLKTSAGTLLNAKLVRAVNLVQTVSILKDNGFWIMATEMNSKTLYYNYDFNYKTAIILGSEGKGISPLLKKNADYVVSIPYPGPVESLNVSASASIILFEALRQKNIRKPETC